MPAWLVLCISLIIIASLSSAASFTTDSSTKMTTAVSKYHLRPYDPTSESDRSSLEELCANEFGGNDYVPRMASSYAANPACSFLALTTKNDDEDNKTADGGKILAVVNYKRLSAQNSAWIEAVRTHPDHRNQGLASSLLRSMIELSEQETVESMPRTNLLTCTVQSNRGMLRAFEKVGFAHCDTIQILDFKKIIRLPGWKADSEKTPLPLLDALDLHHLVSPAAKSISSSSSWRTISTDEELLERLQQCKSKGCSGYLPGLYEYIVPGPNRLDLKQSMENGLVLALDSPNSYQKETSSCENNTEEEKNIGQAVLVFTRDDRISSLKSNWVCSIVAHTQLAFEAALFYAHSPDVARLMNVFQCEKGTKNAENADDIMKPMPFCLVFDNAVPLLPGTLAEVLPRVTDECVVFSYEK